METYKLLGNELEIKNAAQRHENALAGLYRDDGQPMYGAAEMKERQASADAALIEAMERVNESATAFVQSADVELAQLDTQTAVDWLSDTELHAANLRRELVNEDVARADAATIKRRLEAAVSSADRVKTFLLARAITARIAAENRKPQRQRGDVMTLAIAAKTALDSLQPASLAAQRSEVEEARKRAQSIGIDANKRRLAVQGAGERFKIARL